MEQMNVASRLHDYDFGKGKMAVFDVALDNAQGEHTNMRR
jgi:hypothetical protein